MNKNVLGKLLQIIKPYLGLILISLLCSAIAVVMQLYAPILSGRAIDYIIDKGNVDIARVTQILIRLVIVIGVAAISQWILSMINNKIVYKTVCELRIKCYKHINTLPIAYVDSKEHGDIVSRVLSDIDQLSDGLLMGFSQLFTGVITIIGTICFMLRVNPIIAIVVIVLTPMSLLIAGYISKKTYNLFLKQSENRAKMTAHINEMLSSQKVVQVFNYEEESERRFEEINADLVESEFKATFFSSLTNPSTRLINNIVYAGVAIVGSVLALAKSISIGDLTCFLSYATQYAKPFNEISGVMTELQGALACAARVFDLLEQEPESSDEDNAELFTNEGIVSLDKVDFSYNKDKPLIKDLSLNVSAGKKVAIVGPTGSGKSTIINLLMRFYDIDAGQILIDHKDINTLKRQSLRESFGMVLQETWLKSGTIRDNIAYGKPNATDEEIIAAAKLTHADRFIRRLPDGYNTKITEDGGNLSAGQKQLLCITRVALQIPPMLILDEATSSIDTRTEQRIQKSFDKLMEGRTSFVVAHRLSTIKESDIILVMKEGSVIEQGTHDELLAKMGFYYDLYKSQFTSSEK